MSTAYHVIVYVRALYHVLHPHIHCQYPHFHFFVSTVTLHIPIDNVEDQLF